MRISIQKKKKEQIQWVLSAGSGERDGVFTLTVSGVESDYRLSEWHLSPQIYLRWTGKTLIWILLYFGCI